ncbi:MAG: SMC-Scp complex subunit ScpB [Planctomycetales bacterium]|nr:SMC-Scp complex subunit ScpB [Planctomycetales bacterium]
MFLAREPLNSRRLAQLAELRDAAETRTLIRRLNEHYQRVNRAFRIEQIAAGYRLMSRPQYAGWLRRLNDETTPQRLSAPALETLAVVAYRQPVLRAEIEAIRGVSCGELLRQLMDRNLVRISGRSEELGRPFLYSTTRTFLSAFGLNSLDDLPRASIDRRSISGSDPQPEVSARADDAQAVAIPSQEDADVTVTAKRQELTAEDIEQKKWNVVPAPVAAEDDDDFGYDDDEEDDDDDEDEEEELEEEDFDEEEFEDDDEDEDDEDEDVEYEDEEDGDWEEVEDDEEEEEGEDADDAEEEFEDEEEEEWEEEEEEWDDDEEEDEDEEEEDEDWE